MQKNADWSRNLKSYKSKQEIGGIIMKEHVMKLENNCVIVDEEYFNEIKKKAESNQERINEIAEEKFLHKVHL